MADFSKIELSGSTDGRPIKVVQTATAGTLIHTAQAGVGADYYDEIWLFVTNTSVGDVILTIEWGGVTSPDDLIPTVIEPQAGLNLVIPGLILQNSLVVRAFASSANVLNITGFVNRVTA